MLIDIVRQIANSPDVRHESEMYPSGDCPPQIAQASDCFRHYAVTGFRDGVTGALSAAVLRSLPRAI
jgi:hypothetical protein